MSVEFNSAQQKVIDHKGGPLLVVAGAGTGKTGVVVGKINSLLQAGIAASGILALTFTEKAAAEMLDRVTASEVTLNAELPIMTFNAFGESLLREFNVDIGLSRRFLLMGENAKVVFLQQHLAQLQLEYFAPISNPEALLPDVADYFSKLKQHVVTPDTYRAYVSNMPASEEADKLDKTKHEELAKAYGLYIELCKQKNVIDYDDQIYRVIELLRKRPNIQKLLQARYHTILVDEFQDTNPMQSQLIDLLVNKQQNLIVVGDDDQSIYGFRGATLANILQFKERYPKTAEVTLQENYRSSQSILDTSYRLIEHNNPNRLEATLHISKKLHAQTNGPAPQLCYFKTLNEELQWIAEDIEKKLKAGVDPGDIAILCRRNVTAQQISEVLQLADIEHSMIGERQQLYKTEVVRMLVEALRAVVDKTANVSLYHTLSGALFNVPIELLTRAASGAKSEHSFLSDFIEQQSDTDYAPLQSALKQITQWRNEAGQLSVGRLTYRIIDQTGYKDVLYRQSINDEISANQVSQLSEFFNTLKEFESIATQPTAMQYIESFAVLEAAGESIEDGTLDVNEERVSILTIHKAKGLEWGVVYIPDCTEGSFPLRARPGGLAVPEQLVQQSTSVADEHIAEERRLMYVALTRAKTDLIVSYSERHRSLTPRKPSRFIAETFDTQADNLAPAQKAEAKLEFSPAPASAAPIPKSIFDGKIVHLSVSQLTTFLQCPLDFYFRFVLAIPEEPSSAAQYGSALHSSIEELNKALKTGTPITLEELETTLKDSWQNSGYQSKQHEERSWQQARKTLKNFYTQHYTASKLAPSEVEMPFSVLLSPEDVRLRGRYDAVFEDDSGVEIRDYKTSVTVTTPEKAKQRTSGSEQLTLYALVWQQLHGELPTKLSLEFVDTNLLGEIKKTQRGIDTMRQKIANAALSIKAGEFKPGADHRYCHHPEI